MRAGLALIAQGIVLYVLSEPFGRVLSMQSSNHMHLAATSHPAWLLWLNAMLTSVWLYLNFAGLSYIAIGASRCIGIKVPPNFNNPFVAKSLTDFWRRWHITLGDWLRQNVFNFASRLVQKSRWKFLAFLIPPILTMLACGVWHDVTFSFLIWGAVHGIGITTNMAFIHYVNLYGYTRYLESPISKSFSWALTQMFVVLTWVFFFPLPSDIHASTGYAAAMFGLL